MTKPKASFLLRFSDRLRRRRQEGQGIVEYALILVLVAIVAIIAVTTVGQQTSGAFSSVSNSLTGKHGTGPVTVSNVNNPTGSELIVTGQSEIVIPGCNLTITPGPTVSIAWSISISQDDYGIHKGAELSLRRDDTTGAILDSYSVGDQGDSEAGDQYTWIGAYTDSGPTDGKYVITVQETSGSSNTQIWSATRQFSLTTTR
jgi:pilus assembly protein Flp/PilA